MSGRDQWVEKILAKEAKGRAKVAELTSEDAVNRLVRALNDKAAHHAELARQLAQVDMFVEAERNGLTSSAAFSIAEDLRGAYVQGKPITVKARLQSATDFLAPDAYGEKMAKDVVKVLTRKELAAKKKAAKA